MTFRPYRPGTIGPPSFKAPDHVVKRIQPAGQEASMRLPWRSRTIATMAPRLNPSNLQ